MQQKVPTDHAHEERVLSEALDRRVADRASRKRRRLLLLWTVPLALLLVANIALAVSLSQVRGELDEVRDLAAPGAAGPGESGVEGSVVAEEIADLKRSVEGLQQALRQEREASGSPGSAPTEGEVAQVRREVRRTRTQVTCTQAAVRRLDTSLRRLLTRDLNADDYVSRPLLPDC